MFVVVIFVGHDLGGQDNFISDDDAEILVGKAKNNRAGIHHSQRSTIL